MISASGIERIRHRPPTLGSDSKSIGKAESWRIHGKQRNSIRKHMGKRRESIGLSQKTPDEMAPSLPRGSGGGRNGQFRARHQTRSKRTGNQMNHLVLQQLCGNLQYGSRGQSRSAPTGELPCGYRAIQEADCQSRSPPGWGDGPKNPPTVPDLGQGRRGGRPAVDGLGRNGPIPSAACRQTGAGSSWWQSKRGWGWLFRPKCS